MGETKFPNGLSVMGIPVIPTGSLIPMGVVYFVSSALGKDGNEGISSATPLATFDKAMSKVSAGDFIYLMPGHTEDLADATTFQVDTASVTVIGIGHGTNRPTFTYSATGASAEIDSANCVIHNVVFKSSVSACVVGMNIDADNCLLSDVEFTYDATGDDFVTFVDIDTVNNTKIVNCTFQAELGAGSSEAIRLDTAHFTEIKSCTFYGVWADAVIVGEGALSAGIVIANNLMYNADTSIDNGIDLNVACTGLITNNRIGTLYATAVANLLDPGSCLCTENYAVNAIDKTGVVLPATAAT